MGYPVLKNEHEMHDVGRWQYRPFTLGRLGLPDRLPFSDCQVKAILQVDAGGSEEPMFGYDPNATNKAYNGDLHVMQGEWTKYNSQLKLRAQDEIGSADADVQIQSARNGWRRSLMKSRAQNTIIQRSQGCGRNSRNLTEYPALKHERKMHDAGRWKYRPYMVDAMGDAEYRSRRDTTPRISVRGRAWRG